MEKSKTYCVMTHMGMALQNNADYCCCNVNKESWQDNKREVIRVDTHPLKTAFKSWTRKLISTALDHGIKHPSCQYCWDLEETTGTSARLSYNKTFGHLEKLSTQPRILVIKPGNTCNFACRMCNPETSSSWYADGFELTKSNLHGSSWQAEENKNVSLLTFNEYTRTFENIRNSFNPDNEDFWSTIKEWIPNFEYIDIYGGEPFLTPAMFDALEHGAKTGAAGNITLSLHTNVSRVNETYAKTLTHYKHVNFKLSIDSMVPAQFSYIRHKGNLETTIANAKKFIEIFKPHPNVNIDVTLTITPLNVFYVDQIKRELVSAFALPVTINIVTTPEYDIRHLPVPVKNLLIATLKDQKIVEFLKKPIPGCDVEWPKFCRATDKLDQLRGQNFSNTFPDWWEMLRPHWVK
jgi:MoaA/NifB/PqqE/SkfB family radical SAM enzyme